MTFDPTKPEEGVFPNLPEAQYRAADAISQSLLKEFGESATPLHFKARKPKVATADMEFGTVGHCFILQPERFHLAYHLKPAQYPNTTEAEKQHKIDPSIIPRTEMSKWNGNSTWCKAWLKSHSDRPIMTQEQLDKLPRIRERLLRLEEFGAALKHGQTEVSFF